MSVIDTLVTDRVAGATYGYEDLNRVEEAVAYIAEHAEEIGVILNPSVKTDWTIDDIPTTEAMNRLIENVINIRRLLPVLPTTPQAPQSMSRLSFIAANNIEKILRDTDRLVGNTIGAWSYAGDIFAGEMI